jgi:hypothetical protein
VPYRSLKILVDGWHGVNWPIQLIDMIQCFPQAERLQIIWKTPIHWVDWEGLLAVPSTIPPIELRIANAKPVQGLDHLTVLDIRAGPLADQLSWIELGMILAELRLPNVKKLSIWLPKCDGQNPDEVFGIRRLFSHIAYKALDNFNLTLEYVVWDLPASCPWVSGMRVRAGV